GVIVTVSVAVHLHLGSGEPLVVSLSQVLQVKSSLLPYTPLFRSLKVPSALRVTLPWAGSLSLVAVRVLPSASVSLARTLAAVLWRPLTAPHAATAEVSFLVTGESLTGVTVIETVAVPLHLGSATGGAPVLPLSQVL